jgi:GNAT superfamily N-acetyltransferase
MKLRPATPGDAETLLAIQRAASVAAFAHIYPPERYPFPSDEVLTLWHEALRDRVIDVYVSEAEAEAVGVVSVDDDWLRTLYVVPEHWSHGVGSALLEHALVRMRERGATRAKLWTLEDNESARRFYERRGWRLTAETRIVPFPPHPIDVQYSKEL